MNAGTAFGPRFGGIADQSALAACLLTLSVGLAVAWVAVSEPGAYRLALAVLLAANLLVISARWPRAAVVGTLAGLPFLALLRRLLIHDAGWSSSDPLLLIAPVVAIAIAYRLFAVEHRRLAPDRLSKLVLAVFAVTLLQTLNPTGAGLDVNAAGFLFAGVPLIWFFIGREMADEGLVVRFGAFIVLTGALIALYGLRQTSDGFLPWDAEWIRLGGYESLAVGEVTRSFGTFASAAEYAQYTAAALLVALALVVYRRRWPLLVVPVLAVALFLASVRTTLILAVVAVIVVVIFRTVRRPALAAAASVGAILMAVAVVQFLAPALEGEAHRSQSDLVEHQLGGVADPLHHEQSTLNIHARMVREGMVEAFHHPLGQGTGITTQAANALDSDPFTTEVDLTDAFVSLGIAGGLLYLALIVTAFARAMGVYWRARTLAALIVIVVMIVSLGQWRNGGHYAVSAIVWFLLGWVASDRAEAPADG